MQFKEVVGTRRSTRLWFPWRPVEEWKIQAILEAIHQAPRLLELDLLRTVVMRIDQLSEEQLKEWQTPTTTTQLEMVRVLLWMFADMDALEKAMSGTNLEALMEAGALNESHGWTPDRLSEEVLPYYQAIMDAEPKVGIKNGGFTQDEDAAKYSLESLSLARNVLGVGHAYALLTGVRTRPRRSTLCAAGTSRAGDDVHSRSLGRRDADIHRLRRRSARRTASARAPGGHYLRRPIRQSVCEQPGHRGAPCR